MLSKRYLNFDKRKKCLSCNSKNLTEILNLGLHSFADRFIKKNDLKKKDPSYPLVLDFCKKCSFIQSKYKTNPKDRYINYDYSYTSSNSKYSINHWKKYADNLERNYNLKNKTVIEIGSNDGLLSFFIKKKAKEVISIDASPFMVKLARSKKLKSYCYIFNFENSKKIKKISGLADIIIANNVFNHADDPKNFLKGVKNLLKKDGKFIFEQPYFLKTLATKKFDQIYHEHISYFTVKNIKNLLAKVGLKINKLYFNQYHGGSVRTICSFNQTASQKKNQVSKIRYEENKGIYKLNFFKNYSVYINKNKARINKIVNFYKMRKFKVIGVGAGAKTNTYLTFNDLNYEKIDFVTDASKFKIGKFTPHTRIPIKNDKIIKKYKKIVCIILSWNISTLLQNKLIKINKGIKFIKP
ncbi:class I SAM-dependent methyltransferase [Candidatus Pelagibacter sp.]|uniref:class I SAM-dependent methyltransferase n=1 Tax=Candidatus Pelagibacter sp. TaxID=2024849 RepID=UPI003F857BE7